VQAGDGALPACQLPAETGTPLSRWSCPELARGAVSRGIAEALSAFTVRRWLERDVIKPWRYRSWIFIRDPDFRVKARIMDLYAGLWQGEMLGEDDYVISGDEKTSIQARCRCHPTLAQGQARPTGGAPLARSRISLPAWREAVATTAQAAVDVLGVSRRGTPCRGLHRGAASSPPVWSGCERAAHLFGD
jgi:hypothetical protein